VARRVAALNARYRHHSATDVLRHAMTDPEVGRLAHGVVLRGGVGGAAAHGGGGNRHLPVLFIDTEMLFAETLAYQLELTERLRLTNVQVVRASREAVFERDNEGLLHQYDPDACCALRRPSRCRTRCAATIPGSPGRKRYQGTTRAALEFFENEGDLRIKVNRWPTGGCRTSRTTSPRTGGRGIRGGQGLSRPSAASPARRG
jgi:phosphoadenosine phosphosulfate reductase